MTAQDPPTQTMTQPENRSEIVFVTDAQDCNPNGNPMGENRPRIDPVTGKAAITDVRLKRYLRDQLQDDNHTIFVKKTDEEGSTTRAKLALDLFDDIDSADDVAAIENVSEEFLAAATDVRYFGATLSFNKSPEDDLYQAVKEHFPSQFTGPVQFSPARSLNAVEETDELSSLTSVIATQEDKEQGGFGLDDNRIKYGIFSFHGLVDENGAADTNLTERDIERLDTLCWRALKNQTISRSKVGQEPRLYIRVEYDTPGYHEGDLHTGIDLDEDYSNPDSELESIRDVGLDLTPLVDQVIGASNDGHIDSVHIVGSDRLTITVDGDPMPASALHEYLAGEDVSVDEIDVYDEFQATLPEE